MKNLLVLTFVCVPLTCSYALESERRSFPAAGLAAMEISAETGAIRVDASSGNIVDVTVTGNDPQKCRLTMKIDGKKLILKAEHIKKNGFFSDNSCPAGFEVSAPAALKLRAGTGTGEIRVSGLSGEAAVASGTGDISVHSLTGSLKAENGAGTLTGDVCAAEVRVAGGVGRVELEELCGSVRVNGGTGSVALQWKKVPAAGEARVNTGTGDITMTFPREAGLQVKLDSGMGSKTNEFGNTGKFLVSAKSGMGTISVLKAVK